MASRPGDRFICATRPFRKSVTNLQLFHDALHKCRARSSYRNIGLFTYIRAWSVTGHGDGVLAGTAHANSLRVMPFAGFDSFWIAMRRSRTQLRELSRIGGECAIMAGVR